jgi:hypothetical protein
MKHIEVCTYHEAREAGTSGSPKDIKETLLLCNIEDFFG